MKQKRTLYIEYHIAFICKHRFFFFFYFSSPSHLTLLVCTCSWCCSSVVWSDSTSCRAEKKKTSVDYSVTKVCARMQCEMKVGGQWQCLQQAFHVFIPFVISFFFLLCKEFGSDSKRKKKWCVSQCELLTPATSSASEERLCFLHRERFPHKYMYEWVGRGPISCPRYGLKFLTWNNI